jgi:hypothetical protein
MTGVTEMGGLAQSARENDKEKYLRVKMDDSTA